MDYHQTYTPHPTPCLPIHQHFSYPVFLHQWLIALQLAGLFSVVQAAWSIPMTWKAYMAMEKHQRTDGCQTLLSTGTLNCSNRQALMYRWKIWKYFANIVQNVIWKQMWNCCINIKMWMLLLALNFLLMIFKKLDKFSPPQLPLHNSRCCFQILPHWENSNYMSVLL